MEIIAEIGQNHNGDMNLAFELIAEAKRNGADAAKFQLSGSIVVTDASNESIPASRLSDEQVDAARELAGSRGTTAATLISAPAVAQAATADDGDGVLRDDVFVFGVDPN